MPKSTAIRDFARYAEHLPEIEPDVIETLVEFKESYFNDAEPTRWRTDMLRELLLGVLPRKVTAPDDWFAAVVPTTRAYLDFLSTHGQLARGSDSASLLLAEVDRIGDGVLDAARDPSNFGMAKAIFSAVGFDASAPDPARAALEAFNALPDAQRAAILDPAMGNLGPGSVLALPPLGDPFEDEQIWPPLPLTWLPPAAELSGAVLSAPLVRSLLRLAAWNGGGHKVTREAVLTLPAARRACADLGLPVPATSVRAADRVPALHRLWSLATDSEILAIEKGSAVRGEAADLLTDPDHAPEAVVAWWSDLFISCLDWVLDAADDPDEDDEPDDEILETVDDVVIMTLSQLYAGIGLPASGVAEVVASSVEATCDELLRLPDLSPEEVREQALRRWSAHLAQLIDVGALVVQDDVLSLTPLGRAGVRAAALADGADAPLAEDPAALDAATLLEQLPRLGTPVTEPLLAEWSSARSPHQAVEELLDAARTGRAIPRMAAVTVLLDLFHDHITGSGRHRIEALLGDPVLGLSAHILLAEPGHPLELPPHLRQWAALDTVAAAVDSGLLEDTDAAAKVWEIVDADADLELAWSSAHPELIEVLEAVAANHPRGRTRKAAKKSLFKARHPEKARHPGNNR